MLELYHAGLTSCSKKSRHCLREKGLDYESRFVSIPDFEHHRPEYLSLNPAGVVPTLVHDGHPIAESGVINEYLDEVFPDPPLTPKDPRARARMRVFAKMADEYGLPAIRVPTWTRIKTEALAAMREDEFEAMIDGTPIVDHRDKMRALRSGGFDEKEFRASAAVMDYLYKRCEQALADGPYLAGDMFTLADIALLPYLDGFLRTRPELLDGHPRVADWHGRMIARPAVEATYKPSAETGKP